MTAPGRILLDGTTDPDFVCGEGQLYIQKTSGTLWYNPDGTASGWIKIPLDFSNIVGDSSPGILGFYLGYNPNNVNQPTETGVIDAVVATDNGSARVQDADGSGMQQSTNASATTNAAYSMAAAAADRFTQRRYEPVLNMKIKLGQTGDQRFWAGWTSVNIATTLGSDDPAAAHMAGVQARDGDTNFFFVVKDGTTINRVDSGIAKDTAAHFVIVKMNGSEVTIELRDTNFALEATNTFTTNLPGSTTSLGFVVGFQSILGSVKTINQYAGYFSAKL